ncbi:alpha/beta fold hydrolase [Saccharopolyspora sp. NPDC002578]
MAQVRRDSENREVRRSGETTIRYTVSGPVGGSAVVLVHGWAGNRTEFDELTGFLPEENRVIVVDLAEHGESRSGREVWTVEEFARDVVAVLDAESVHECVVVGHSLGGAVVVEVARLRPEVVTRIVALDALHYLFVFGALDEEQAGGLLRPLREDFAGFVRSMVEASSPVDTDPGLKESYFAKMSSVRQPAGTKAFEGLIAWDMEAALSEVRHPITVFGVGEKIAPEAVERLGDRMHLVPVGLGAHYFHVELPEETGRLVADVVQGQG